MRLRKRAKYGNKRTNGFASKREARRYQELLLRGKAGEIHGLRCQVPYELEVNGELICTYIADFEYEEKAENKGLEFFRHVVEDSKGVRTPLYKLKKKLMWACHKINIREV